MRLSMERIKVGIQWVTTAAAALWTALPELTQLLILLMAADIVLGIILAIKERDLSPSRAWSGITKKIVSLLLVGVAGLVNPHVHDFIEINLVQAASAFYIVPELASIMRNAAAMDVPVFVQLKDIMSYFQAASGDSDARNASEPE